MSIIIFAIINAPPGDYADFVRSNMIGQGGASAAAASAAAEEYRVRYGLNDPLVMQYFRWIWGILSGGDFGHSFFYNKPVAEVVGERLPATIAIALTCHFFASLLGISFGILAATRQYSWVDTILSFVSFLGMTIPRFLLALIILYLLAFKLNVQELGSFFSSRYGGQDWWQGPLDFNWAKFWNLVQHVWPVVLIATFGGLAYNMRVMRGNLLDTLNAGCLSGRDPALYDDRRDRSRHRVWPCHRWPGDCRLDGHRRCLCHRDPASGAGHDPDHRQYHC
ncbi:MAG: ABC transporter permease [Maritimibacter sp.]